MDLSNPIGSVIPSAHGTVLKVLARTGEPLSGRQVAALTDGRFGQRRVNDVLGHLVHAGVVLREDRPPAKLYRLNRRHVAADGVVALAEQWNVLISRMRGEIERWQPAPEAAWLFGSSARGDAGPDSDIDVLLVRTLEAASGDAWRAQLDSLSEFVLAWSGNPCEILELSVAEMGDAVERGDRLVRDLRDHAIVLTGSDPRTLLKPTVSR